VPTTIKEDLFMHRLLIAGVVAILFGMALSAPEVCATLSYTETPIASNFGYTFTLQNTLNEVIYEIYLEVPIASSIILSLDQTPLWGDGCGWPYPYYGPLTANTTFLESWSMIGYELAVGDSLTGFGFLASSRLNGPVTYSLNADPSIFGTADLVSGSTSVPIPASLLLLASGLIGLVGIRRRFTK
jgi:hypothetical protein